MAFLPLSARTMRTKIFVVLVAVGAGVLVLGARLMREEERPPAIDAVSPVGPEGGRVPVTTEPLAVRPVLPSGTAARALLGAARMDEVQAAFPFLDLGRVADAAQWVSLDHEALSRLVEGDSFPWPIDGLPARQALVESVVTYEGMRRVSGSLLGADDRLAERFSMTLSSDRSYVAGHVWVNGGEFALQARNGKGWLGKGAQAAKRVDDAISADAAGR